MRGTEKRDPRRPTHIEDKGRQTISRVETSRTPYLTLQKDGKIIHIGRKYVSGIDGNGNSLMSTVITVLDGDHEEQFSDVEDTIARIVDIYA